MFYARALRESPELQERFLLMSRRMFVEYPLALDIIADIELLTMFKQDEREGRLIVAPSGNGKTYIAKRILRSFPPSNDPRADAAQIPVIRVLLPGKASRREFAQQVLRALGQTRKPSTQTDELLASVFRLLPALGVKTVLLDDFQHLNSGPEMEKIALRNEIKKLGEECDVSVIALGLPTALNVVSKREELLGRFDTFAMPRWQVNDDLRALVYYLEQNMNLGKASNLADNDPFLTKLVAESEGTIGAIVKILRRCAVASMISGSEQIKTDTFKEIAWIKPSKRIITARTALGIPTLAHGKESRPVADPPQAKAA